MVVAGFDPGSLRFGVGLIRQQGGECEFLHAEEIVLAASDFSLRMGCLWEKLSAVFLRFPVQSVGMEEGFLGKNVRSMSLLAMVRGVALAAAVSRGVPVKLYAPRLIKQALTGNGSASKEQVNRMVRRLLHFPAGDRLGLDASDALAVAFCHARYAK